MGWARLDDGWHDHPKTVSAGLEGAGLFAMCLTWAYKARKTSPHPGFVPKEVVARFAGSKANRLARRLVELRSFEPVEGGWMIHDFKKYLPKYDSQQAAEAGKKGASARWGEHPDEPPPDDEPPYNRDGKPPPKPHGEPMARADAGASARRNPVPTPYVADHLTQNVAIVDARDHDEHTLAGGITALYATGVPLSDHGRAHRVIAEALEHYPHEDVRQGVLRLVAERRTCTPDALRIAIHATDPPPLGMGPPVRRRTASEKASQWLTVGTEDETPPPLRALPGGLA